jgi:hypothetical protein
MFRALSVRQIKNKVLYNLGEYFCVNNTDQMDRQPPTQTGAVWQKKQMLPIVQDRSKPTPIVRDRPKVIIQRSKTLFYTSKINLALSPL